MKKPKKSILFLFLICSIVLLTACKEENDNGSYYIIEDVVDIPEPKDDQELLTADKTILKLFYPDETGQVMLTKFIEVEEISKISIIEHILELEYINKNTRLIKLTGEEFEDGTRIMVAEFSEEFGIIFEEKDEKQGQIIFGCIVNTILDAYDASGIQIQVGNKEFLIPLDEFVLEMDEADVPEGYYSSFALTHVKSENKEVVIQNETQTITYEQFLTEEGYSIYYEKDNYLSGYDELEGLVVFESLDFKTTMSIYESESSKDDMVQILTEELALGVEEDSEIVEMEMGLGSYDTIGIFKQGAEQTYNYYVVAKDNQIFVIEIRMNKEIALEQSEHIAKMLETFQIW